MVFDVHGETAFGGIERGSFRDGPAFQDAVNFEAEIVVEPGSVVFLDDEALSAGGVFASFGLGRFAEVAFTFVLGEL